MKVSDAIAKRKTVKKYLEEQNVEESVIRDIVEAGRMAPSSMGLEPTQVLVVREPKFKAWLAEKTMWGQNRALVNNADTLFILLTATKRKISDVNFLTERLGRRLNIQDENDVKRLNGYVSSIQKMTDLDSFGAYQTYITVGYMSLAATEAGLGSTILGGFSPELMDEVLKEHNLLNRKEMHSVICLAVGKFDDSLPGASLPRVRVSEDEFSKWIK